jgi:hypothetical protein
MKRNSVSSGRSQLWWLGLGGSPRLLPRQNPDSLLAGSTDWFLLSRQHEALDKYSDRPLQAPKPEIWRLAPR